MLTYSFDENNHKSLYQQLYTFIKNDILGGHLTADEKLPSKRTFAKNLGISIKLLFCKWVVIIRLFTMFRAHCISISHSFWRQNSHFYKF